MTFWQGRWTRLRRDLADALAALGGTRAERTGIPPETAGKVGSKIAALPGIELTGILTHAGHAHDVSAQPDIEAVARSEARVMQRAAEELTSQGIDVRVVSAGSTITAPYLTADDGSRQPGPCRAADCPSLRVSCRTWTGRSSSLPYR